jgi:hypothetical protein
MSDEKTLQEILSTLQKINCNMLKVFWIVTIFALLYFGLLLYLFVN